MYRHGNVGVTAKQMSQHCAEFSNRMSQLSQQMAMSLQSFADSLNSAVSSMTPEQLAAARLEREIRGMRKDLVLTQAGRSRWAGKRNAKLKKEIDAKETELAEMVVMGVV